MEKVSAFIETVSDQRKAGIFKRATERWSVPRETVSD